MGATDNLEQQLALLKALADKPLTLPPVFVDITGSHTAGLLLSQSIYWTRRNAESDGWFWVLLPKLQEQLRMGKHALDAARKELTKLGFLEEKLRGVPPKLHLRVRLDKVLEAVNLQLSENRKIDYPVIQQSQNGKDTLRKPENCHPETGKLIIRKPESPNKEEETQKQETLQETQKRRDSGAPPVENRQGALIDHTKPRLSQSERDAWDLRRWREKMEKLETDREGFHATYLSEEQKNLLWLQNAKTAAYQAGVPLDRLQSLLKQYFPDDPVIKLLNTQEPLFQESTA